MLSRWPLAEVERRAIPRRSADRKQQVRALVEFLAEPKRQPPITVLCGDFNAAPGSDEIRLLTGFRYTDLGPFRAIRWTSLERLGMEDRDFGWTCEMQMKAIGAGLRIADEQHRDLWRLAQLAAA